MGCGQANNRQKQESENQGEEVEPTNDLGPLGMVEPEQELEILRVSKQRPDDMPEPDPEFFHVINQQPHDIPSEKIA